MSPLQYLSSHPPPEQEGNYTITSAPGQISVTYRILQSGMDDETRDLMLANVEKFHSLQLEIILKGFVSHSLKNRTNVKVDFASVRVSS